MKTFFPGCRVKGRYVECSEKLAEYVEKTQGIKPSGCCKEEYTKIEKDSEVTLICNNCANELRKKGFSDFTFVYELIDKDDNFIFPNYEHQQMYVQLCRHGYEKDMTDTVVSLLKKMNIDPIIIPEVIPEGLPNSEHRELVSKISENYTDKDIITICPICNLILINNGINARYLLEVLFA